MAQQRRREAGTSTHGRQESPFRHADPGRLFRKHGQDLAAAFRGATYKIMLVASKFQTGFDQPLLSAMYVDKKLSGVEDQVREVARLWVERKGNNALSAAVSPARHDFARCYAAALDAGDKVTLAALDLLRGSRSSHVAPSRWSDYGSRR